MKPLHRPIRSYVLRQGRVTDAQRRARDELMPRFGIPYSREPLDLEGVFGRAAPKILEIGFGMGETTARIATDHPGIDYLGIEVHSPGVGSLLKRAAELGVDNLRVIQHDAVEVIEHMIAPASLDGVHIFFPDPWPKKRHHKRRLVTPAFASAVAEVLEPGGELRFVTDHGEYFDEAKAILDAEPRLETAEVPADMVDLTNYERKYRAEGRPIHRAWYRRRRG
jgi:tRNA (guanine-N7-)-methyltransferase